MRVDILNIVKEQVKEHEATYRDDITRDFIDGYLHQRGRSDPNSSFSSDEGCRLIMMTFHLFLASRKRHNKMNSLCQSIICIMFIF